MVAAFVGMEEFVKECSLFLFNVQLQDDMEDEWKWNLDKDNHNFFCGVYLHLTST